MSNILSNIAALKSLYHLNRNEEGYATSIERISSGKRINTAGDEQTESIVQWFKDHHKLAIGERTAEMIKCTVGSAVRTSGKSIAVKGGTTEAGIKNLKNHNIDKIIYKTYMSAYKRAKKLGEKN